MEVTAVESVPTGYDVSDRGWEYSSGTLTAWNSPLVRVETDTGHVGWGEVNRAFQRAGAVPDVLDRLRPHVLGERVESVDAVVESMRRAHLPRGLAESAIGAVEVALYDLLGQARGRPVYELLGGAGTDGELLAYGSGGLGTSVDQRVAQAEAFAAEGFDVVKLRGMPTTEGTLELVERSVAAVGPDVTVAVDDTGAEGLADVLDLVAAMNDHADGVAWFEDPAPSRQDLRAYRRLREAADFPVTGMESCSGVEEFRQALAYDPVDAVHPDASRGGYRHLDAVTAEASAHDVRSVLHVWGGAVTLLANAHYAAASPAVERIEYPRLENPLREEPLPAGTTREGTRLELADAPGLGLDLPAEPADAYPYREGTGHVGFEN